MVNKSQGVLVESTCSDGSITLKPWWVPGGTVWIRQGPGPQASVAVVALHLPDPATFDSSYDRYWYDIQDELTRPMTLEFASLGVWSGIHEGTDVVLPFPPSSSITIAAGNVDGPGPQPVLHGSISPCEPTSTVLSSPERVRR